MDIVQELQTSIGDTLGNIQSAIQNPENIIPSELKPELLTQWIDCFLNQDRLNEFIVPEWKTKEFNWLRAVRTELFECQDSFPWEWWKRKLSQPDFLNAEIELVDTFFFLISASITQTKNERDIIRFATSAYTVCYAHEQEWIEKQPDYNLGQFDQEEFCKSIDHFIKITLNNSNLFVLQFIELIKLWLKLGLKLNDFIKAYNAKAVLNEFRQHNGYKQGTYNKIWNDIEDNKVCWHTAKHLELNEDFKTNLYSKLEELYSNFK